MSEDAVLATLDRLLVAVEATQALASDALDLIAAHRERMDELTEDVAGLGLRLVQLEAMATGDHSLGVTTRKSFRTLDELASVLRIELADLETALTARIDSVHEPALRALTSMHERNRTA